MGTRVGVATNPDSSKNLEWAVGVATNAEQSQGLEVETEGSEGQGHPQ